MRRVKNQRQRGSLYCVLLREKEPRLGVVVVGVFPKSSKFFFVFLLSVMSLGWQKKKKPHKSDLACIFTEVTLMSQRLWGDRGQKERKIGIFFLLFFFLFLFRFLFTKRMPDGRIRKSAGGRQPR